MSFDLHNLKLNTAFSNIDKGNYKAAYPVLREFAKKGDIDAQYQLAFMYEQGLGLKADFVQAAKWYEAAAKQGDVASQFNLAELLEDGEEGIEQDYIQAAFWYEQAANQGDIDAMNNLARLYAEGLGHEQD